MKNIEIWVIERQPNIKSQVTHTDDGIKIKRLPKSEWKNHTTARGRIRIQEEKNYYEKRFFIDLDCWKLEDFERQWQEGLARIKAHDNSCLVENITHLWNGRISRSWWLLYKIDNKIHLQSRFLFAGEVGNRPFTPETCYSFIPAYKTHEDDGEKIPEFIVDPE